MGFPSPHDIYGTLTYRDATYTLANRVFDKALAEKLTAYVRKEQIDYLPIYPHIPKNPLTAYEIIDERLYITGISFNGKSYSVKEIFGEERMACCIDGRLDAVEKVTDFFVEKSCVSRREMMQFHFQNGVLDSIEKEIDFWARRAIALAWLLEEAVGVVGIFWIANDRVYSAKQILREVDEEIEMLHHSELWDYFVRRYETLKEYQCEALNRGRVVFDTKHKAFTIYIDSEADIDLVIDAFHLKEKPTKIVIEK